VRAIVTRDAKPQEGFVLVAVLLVAAALFLVAGTLLLQSRTERVVSANEQDHLAALAHAESGLTWAQRRVLDTNDMTDLLLGPDDVDVADDHLIGLRDLSLTSAAQFTLANEATASAIVSRDFDGQGSKTWEVIRTGDGTDARALVYVRLDDNFDDDPDDPGNDDPLTDTDDAARVTVVAEYPVFVDATGVEYAVAVDRGRARRTLVARFVGSEPASAVMSNEDIQFTGGEICGDCGSMHANGDLDFSSGTSVCQNATAAGTFTGSTGGVGGEVGGSFPPFELPVINPYDDLYVPSIDVFDTAGDTALPSGLRCPLASAADPGANKYFALVANPGGAGQVWKAYWDFGNDRWTWSMIDDLADVTDVALDDCGRAPGDPNYGAGDAGAVSDGSKQEFYGFNGSKLSTNPCGACPAVDLSLCGLTNNDFNANGHYPAGGGGLVAFPVLPGNFQPDGVADYDATDEIDPNWSNTSNTMFSPLYGSVIWVFGEVALGGSLGDSSNVDFQCSATAGCTSTVLPKGTLPMSLITAGSINLSGSANISPANPDAGYHFLLVAGRDILLSGNTQEDTHSCAGSCSTAAPADIMAIAGVIAAHEQIGVGGNPNIFGFLVAEEAGDCSNEESAPTKLNGTPEIFYDCNHPPNPWATGPRLASWEEAE
jgi:hypothetical protein